MTGSQLIAYLQRRLGEDGMAVPSGRTTQLEDALTEARDDLVQVFAEAAPIVVRSIITLVVNGSNDRLYDWPGGGVKDPYTVLFVRSVTNQEELTPAARINEDEGSYIWRNIKQLEIADGVEPPGGIELGVVLHQGDITSATTEVAIGLPTTCHRAIGKGAHVLLATADDQNDESGPLKVFGRELKRLVSIYGGYDANGGEALRHAILASYGQLFGDMLY